MVRAMDHTSKWHHIDVIAERLGVKLGTRRKWRQRGSVPHRWRLPILQASGGVILADDFIVPPRRKAPDPTRFA
jgi:hypothetical protein